MFERSSITQAVNSVYKSLQNRLINEYEIKDIEESSEISDKILKIHGLDRDRFSIINSVEELIEGHLNDVSIDDNSNKNEKTVKGILKESEACIDKLTGYRFLYRKLSSIYGKKEANYLSGLMYDYSLALSDSTQILTPYCWSFDSSKLVTIGKPFGQLQSTKCKRVDSYISLLNEVVHTMSNQIAGAISCGSFILDISHLLLINEKKNIDDLKDKDFKKYITNQFQRFIHGVNSLSRSSHESPFTNISLFDRVKLRNFIENDYKWYFSDVIDIENEEESISDIIEFIIELQNIYIEFFDKGDPSKDGMPYRFPVNTINLSKNKKHGGQWEIGDKKFLKSICKKDIYRYNIFVSEGFKSASCCFDEEQKVLLKSSESGVYTCTFKEFENLSYKENKSNLGIAHNGNWVKGKLVKLKRDNKKMYEIVTANKKKMIVTEDHTFLTDKGDKKVLDLSTNDYLVYNTLPFNSIPENNLNLTYEQGILIGAYLGDGSNYVSKTCNSVTINFSLNEEKYKKLLPFFKKALNDFNLDSNITLATPYNNVYPVAIHNVKLLEKIKYWVKGNYCYEKELNLNCLLQSKEFRQGIIDGIYLTDGGNSNRIYTTSKKLVDQLEIVIMSLGNTSIIDESDRRDEKVIIRGEEFNRNHILYCIRFYSPNYKRTQANIYKFYNNSLCFRVKSIKELKNYNKEYVYCFEMSNKNEPYFTLPNGVISHNCRLLSDSDMLDLSSQVNSFGAGSSVSLGSHRVLTINFVRIAMMSKNIEDFYLRLKEKVDETKKILYAHKQLMYDFKEVSPFIKEGWIQLNRMFSTIGIIGVTESNDILKNKFKELNKRDLIFDILSFLNKEVISNNEKFEGCFFNVEEIPGESMSHRLCKVDKLIFGEENINYNIYANQFIPLWDEKSTVWDRIEKDGKYVSILTGGGIVHLNIGEHITGKQSEKLILYAVEKGCEHFALTGTFCQCEDGHVLIGNSDKCQKCGKDVISKIARTVGFFTPVEDWSKEKREFDHKIRKEYVCKDFE